MWVQHVLFSTNHTTETTCKKVKLQQIEVELSSFISQVSVSCRVRKALPAAEVVKLHSLVGERRSVSCSTPDSQFPQTFLGQLQV